MNLAKLSRGKSTEDLTDFNFFLLASTFLQEKADPTSLIV
jgi:hypothetical protein